MKTKILLIDPYFKEGLKGFPLGLAYIAGSLKKEWYVLKALDLTAQSFIKKRNWDKILKEEFIKFNPDIVCITSTSPTHFYAIKTTKIIKKLKNIPIIKGGIHETNCALCTLKNNKEIDYSVIGEGEITITKLVENILNKKPLDDIRGIAYRKDGNIKLNKTRPLIKNLDNLPRPARELFYLNTTFNKYYSANLFKGKKSTPITTSRGCPYNCSFCSAKATWGNLRMRSIENVIKEIKKLYSQGFRGFMFEDDMSLINKEWFLKFSKSILKNKIKITYSLQTRVDCIDKEISKALSKSGCVFMYFGIESGVQRILDMCNKKITLNQAKNAFKIVKKYGIKAMASIQFGLPGEDIINLSTVKETIRFLNKELKPEEVAISYTCLYPSSPLSIQQEVICESYEKEIISNIDKKIYKKTAHGSHSIHPKDLTPEKIEEIENTLSKELKIKRFKVETFYKV